MVTAVATKAQPSNRSWGSQLTAITAPIAATGTSGGTSPDGDRSRPGDAPSERPRPFQHLAVGAQRQAEPEVDEEKLAEERGYPPVGSLPVRYAAVWKMATGYSGGSD
jgi:hypothetical protein